MNLSEAAERNSVWVFGSAKKDLCVFFLPLVAGLILQYVLGPTFSDLKQNFAIYAFFYFVLNTGHIFGTTFPIALDRELRQKIGILRMWLIPAAVILFFGTICLYDVGLFKKLFGLSTLLHILAQHYNWLRVLQKRERRTDSRQFVERFVLLTLIAVPVAIWCAGQTPVSPSYMYANDIGFRFGWVNLRILIWPATALWAGHLAFLILTASRSAKPIPFGKILLFATVYPWLFGSLVWLNSALMFFVYVIGSHAGGYYLYLGHGWNRNHRQPKFHKYLPLLLPLACAIIGVVWNKTSLWILTYLTPGLLFIIWIPVILHYVYDATLWKRTPAERRLGSQSFGVSD
ncbi:hypothetical protein BH10BDE1_BH10BDE1_08070 [soil metagenome]